LGIALSGDSLHQPGQRPEHQHDVFGKVHVLNRHGHDERSKASREDSRNNETQVAVATALQEHEPTDQDRSEETEKTDKTGDADLGSNQQISVMDHLGIIERDAFLRVVVLSHHIAVVVAPHANERDSCMGRPCVI
jgi:hypothetical protein